jgi:AcrR family transcriptional regulator
MGTTVTEVRDGRIQRGEHSRQLILAEAVKIASLEGLEALSLGRLAAELSISKSGVFALFGSKEGLQLATIKAATKIYLDTVVDPARREAAGLPRLVSLCGHWLRYSEDRVFPGGCFFFAVNAEFDARPGPVRDQLASSGARWIGLFEENIDAARTAGDLVADADPGQLAFELIAFLEAANANSVLHEDRRAYTRSARAITHRLRSDATDPGAIPDQLVQ